MACWILPQLPSNLNQHWKIGLIHRGRLQFYVRHFHAEPDNPYVDKNSSHCSKKQHAIDVQMCHFPRHPVLKEHSLLLTLACLSIAPTPSTWSCRKQVSTMVLNQESLVSRKLGQSGKTACICRSKPLRRQNTVDAGYFAQDVVRVSQAYRANQYDRAASSHGLHKGLWDGDYRDEHDCEHPAKQENCQSQYWTQSCSLM